MKTLDSFLSDDDFVFLRLSQFHRERAEKVSSEHKPSDESSVGSLILHLIPQSSLAGRASFQASILRQHARELSPLAGDGNSDYGLFNADGWLMPDGRRSRESYSQLFRSGRLEAVKGGLCYSQNGGKIIRERQCEEAVLRLVPAYFRFCKNIGIEGPIWFFSSLLGCEGAHFRVNPHFSDYSEHAIGERLVTLPEFYFVTLDGDVSSSLRAWCDAFWQTVGVEKSLNYDQDGKRNAQRHR